MSPAVSPSSTRAGSLMTARRAASSTRARSRACGSSCRPITTATAFERRRWSMPNNRSRWLYRRIENPVRPLDVGLLVDDAIRRAIEAKEIVEVVRRQRIACENPVEMRESPTDLFVIHVGHGVARMTEIAAICRLDKRDRFELDRDSINWLTALLDPQFHPRDAFIDSPVECRASKEMRRRQT